MLLSNQKESIFVIMFEDEKQKFILSYMQVMYARQILQSYVPTEHWWPKQKKPCKQHSAELQDEALFKEPPPKEDCPICFLPMPGKLINCFSFPPLTISSVPINDVANIHQELADLTTAIYYSCCGKIICGGCIHSFGKTGNNENRDKFRCRKNWICRHRDKF
jgi:hypothetical protein